jgi:hypothetical protein
MVGEDVSIYKQEVLMKDCFGILNRTRDVKTVLKNSLHTGISRQTNRTCTNTFKTLRFDFGGQTLTCNDKNVPQMVNVMEKLFQRITTTSGVFNSTLDDGKVVSGRDQDQDQDQAQKVVDAKVQTFETLVSRAKYVARGNSGLITRILGDQNVEWCGPVNPDVCVTCSAKKSIRVLEWIFAIYFQKYHLCKMATILSCPRRRQNLCADIDLLKQQYECTNRADMDIREQINQLFNKAQHSNAAILEGGKNFVANHMYTIVVIIDYGGNYWSVGFGEFGLQLFHCTERDCLELQRPHSKELACHQHNSMDPLVDLGQFRPHFSKYDTNYESQMMTTLLSQLYTPGVWFENVLSFQFMYLRDFCKYYTSVREITLSQNVETFGSQAFDEMVCGTDYMLLLPSMCCSCSTCAQTSSVINSTLMNNARELLTTYKTMERNFKLRVYHDQMFRMSNNRVHGGGEIMYVMLIFTPIVDKTDDVDRLNLTDLSEMLIHAPNTPYKHYQDFINCLIGVAKEYRIGNYW